MSELLVQPDGLHDSGPCACCGNLNRRVWGYIHGEDGAMTLYYVYWTLKGVPKHGARFNLVLGNWGADSHPRDRASVALNFRQHEGQPQFRVIDASPADTGNGQLAAKAMLRNEVIDFPIARYVFDCVDALLAQDPRIKELTAV
jgi:hypothetical protein